MDKCFVDMDGVLAEFLGGASFRHDRDLPYDRPEAMGVWETEVLWGITEEQFWAPMRDAEFWATLEKTPEADRIVKLAEREFGEENVAILSAEGPGFSIQGKKEWIKRNYPQFEKRLIFAHAKEFLASPSRWLIDDRDKNIDAFNEAGGHGILVPRLWNRAWIWSDVSLIEVERYMEASRGRN